MRLRNRSATGHTPAGLAAGLATVLAAGLLAAPALCDELVLKNGGRVSGRIVERSATRVVIETGPGLVTLPLSRVERIVESRSSLEVFGERAAELDAGDDAGWTELALWAEERDMLTQARFAWQRVLAVDPGSPQANAGLGRVAVDGVWMSADDAYRTQGYVSYEGRWLTPAEHEAALREAEARDAAARDAREADLRVREAEARAREAEARAAEAEAAASTEGGIPLEYAYGYGGYGYGFGGGVAVVLPGHPGGSDHRGKRSRHPERRPEPGVRPNPAPRHTQPPTAQPASTRRHPPRSAAILPPPQPAPRKR